MSPSPSAVEIVEAADRIIEAARSKRPCAPVRSLLGEGGVDVAYAVQERVTVARLGEGASIVGRKIGLTSPVVQQQLGVDRPDLGVLFDDMAYRGGDAVPIDRFLQPRVEAEIAFVLKEDLVDGDLSEQRVRAAVDYAVAALEICDSRIADWDISFEDTVADNASAGAYVLGPRHVPLDRFEPKDARMSMGVAGQDPARGVGEDCLGDPLRAVAWLAGQARSLGRPLSRGQVVLSGALGPMRPVTPGAAVKAEISGLGSVSAVFCQQAKE